MKSSTLLCTATCCSNGACLVADLCWYVVACSLQTRLQAKASCPMQPSALQYAARMLSHVTHSIVQKCAHHPLQPCWNSHPAPCMGCQHSPSLVAPCLLPILRLSVQYTALCKQHKTAECFHSLCKQEALAQWR